MDDWGTEEFSDWKKSLSKGESVAIKEYANYDFVDINKRLRTGRTDLLRDKHKTNINLLTSALDRSTIPEDVVVYRGVRDSPRVDRLEVGSVIVDNAFVSTSLSSSVAKRFSAEAGYSVEIVVPKGSKGAYRGSLYELELLLQRGSQFSVESKDYANRRLKLRLIGQEPTEEVK